MSTGTACRTRTAGRVGLRRLDVAALVADDERVAVQDPDEGRNHRQLLRLPMDRVARDLRHARPAPGTGAGTRISRRGSPSMVSAPRRSGGHRRSVRPLATMSNVGLVGLDDAVGLAVRRGDTSSAPSLIAEQPVVGPLPRRRCRSAPLPAACRAAAPGHAATGRRRTSAVASANHPTSGHPAVLRTPDRRHAVSRHPWS